MVEVGEVKGTVAKTLIYFVGCIDGTGFRLTFGRKELQHPTMLNRIKLKPQKCILQVIDLHLEAKSCRLTACQGCMEPLHAHLSSCQLR